MKELQKSREGQSVSDETVATYTAAKGFLIGEWFGALLLLASFIQLYVFGLRPGADSDTSLGVGIALAALGAFIFWRSRGYYLSLDFPWKRPWEIGAMVVAASGGVFWLMFLLAWALVRAGIEIF